MNDVIPLPDFLQLACYRISLQPEATVPLPPYKGSVLRGALGIVLKHTVCVRPAGDLCQQCQLPDVCPYAFLFEGRPPSDADVLRGANRIPPPYVLEPPLDRRCELPPGEPLTFHLVLVGNAIRFYPYILAAFREVGHRGIGKARVSAPLIEVSSLAPNGNETALYDPVSGSLIGRQPEAETVPQWTTSKKSPDTKITLSFLTPTRLKYRGDYVHETPPFHVVFRTLLRRVSSLSYFYADQQWDIDYQGWIERAKQVQIKDADIRWHDWGRYSSRQQQGVSMGGVTGRVTYTVPVALGGDLSPFLPVLRLGELIHVGKGTSFGNGRYELQY